MSAAHQVGMLEELRRIAEARGGVCLSGRYVNLETVMRWRCERGHTWETLATYVKRGTWCPKCSAIDRGHTLERMHELAAEQGGECLSRTYDGSLTKLRWRCARGHGFLATPNTVKGGSWCRRCRLAMPGIEDMRRVARERGGECLSLEYVNKITKLRWRCAQTHEWDAAPGHVVNSRSWCPRCAGKNVTIDDMRGLAHDHGGECLSKRYNNIASVLRFRCVEGHVFRTKAANVRAGHWCRRCAGTERLTLRQMQRIARARGGRCVSTKYTNTHTKLTWRCAEGHEWEAAPGHVVHDESWCPECARSRVATIEEMRKLARERGGQCRSKRYIKSRARLRWTCGRGHRFEATPAAVWSGRWCLVCKARGRTGHE